MSEVIYLQNRKRGVHPPRRRSSRAHDLTGRDGFILAQALFDFIANEQQKSYPFQAWSDLQDARAIFNARCPSSAALFAGRYPDLTISLVDEKALARER